MTNREALRISHVIARLARYPYTRHFRRWWKLRHICSVCGTKQKKRGVSLCLECLPF